MPLSLADFVLQLTSTGLVPAEEAEALARQIAPGTTPSESEALARLLIRQHKLTKFQAQRVLGGAAQKLVLGNYVLVDKLGQGGMGTVYKATHRRMNRTVALKVLSPEMVKDETAVQRFHREVQAAARLTHPNIVAALDADEAHGTHFLVMECVEGADLSTIVKRSGPMGVDVAVDCTIQAARGLAFAHQNKVIHRDIKPANLLLDGHGVVKILDMGLARIENDANEATRSDLTSTGTVMGTIDYMSPEQAVNTKHADERSDQYSLGVTLHYLLTGRPCYGGETVMEKLLAHRDKPIPSLRDARADVPIALDGVFRRMVAKRAQDRYPSLSACVTALEETRGEMAEASQMLGGMAANDGTLQAFLTGLDTSPPTLAEIRPTAGGSSSDMTIIVGSTSDTDQPGLSAATIALHSGNSTPPRSSGSVRLPPRRPWWAHPAVWGGATVALCVLLGLLLLRGGDEPAPAPKPAQPTVVQPPRPTTPARPPARVAGSAEEELNWVLSHGGLAFVGPEGAIETVDSVASWKQSPRPITQLDFSRSTAMTDDDIPRLHAFPHLEVLNLQGCKITDLGISRLGNFRQLVMLSLHGTGVTDAGLEYVDHLRSLQTLWVGKTGVRGPGLARVARLSNLRILELAHLDIDDASVQPLSALSNLSELRLMACPRLTDACINHLLRLRLVTFYLDGTPITDAGLDRLAALTTLRHLSVPGTRCTPAGLLRIAKQIPLSTLNYVPGDPISPEDAAALRLALPEATIGSVSPIPPPLSDVLSRIVLKDHAVRGEWRKAGELHTPAPVDGRPGLLKVPMPRPYTDYLVTLLVKRQTDQRRGGLGLILPIGDRQVLLQLDPVDVAGWGVELLEGRPIRENGSVRRAANSNIGRGTWFSVQVFVRRHPSGVTVIAGHMGGAPIYAFDVDPFDASLPESAVIPNWTGLGLVSGDEFSIHTFMVHPQSPLPPTPIGGRLATGPWPDATPIDLPAGELFASPDWDWSTPENLGQRMNTAATQSSPRLSRDGRTFVFQEWAQGGEILQQRRTDRTTDWRTPKPVPGQSDTQFIHPWMNAEGTWLVGVREEASGDLYSRRLVQTRRSDSSQPWGAWEPVFPATADGGAWQDLAPVVSADGLTLYFGSDRPGGRGGTDLWMSRRSAASEPWSAPVNLGAPLNTPHSDLPADITADDLVLLLSSDRPGTLGNMDLWSARRRAAAEPWDAPVNLGPQINSPDGHEYSASLTADGRTLLFDSGGRPGFGQQDLWLTRRTPRPGTSAAERYPQYAPPIEASLSFNGVSDYVEVPEWNYDASEAVTIEAWVAPTAGPSPPQNLVTWLGRDWIALWRQGPEWGAASVIGTSTVVKKSRRRIESTEPVHVAAVYIGGELHLYLHGQPTALDDVPAKYGAGSSGLFLGGVPAGRMPHPGERFYSGRLFSLRMRRGIHYQQAFDPPRELTSDEATLALYRADAAFESQLPDLSGRGRDGKIYSSPPPP